MAEPAPVNRWAKRREERAALYASSTEQAQTVNLRRSRAEEHPRYDPGYTDGWKGKAWGLASTKVQGRQSEKATRYSGGGRGELYYGQKRAFNLDVPPEDPVSFLQRAPPKPKPAAAPPAPAAAAAEASAQPPAKAKTERRRRRSESSSDSSSTSSSTSSGSSGSSSDSDSTSSSDSTGSSTTTGSGSTSGSGGSSKKRKGSKKRRRS
ncbi:hypothetical protein T492DRAFT_955582 [Pavlovales sp. CCMP2436]|nr:hypothetical protein T492DRAFT_955582 [Pavlovales sp. CCMP2436]